MTDGCLAVNVIGNHDITCELTTGLSNENEMQDDSLAELFVSSKKIVGIFPDVLGKIMTHKLFHPKLFMQDWLNISCWLLLDIREDYKMYVYPKSVSKFNKISILVIN